MQQWTRKNRRDAFTSVMWPCRYGCHPHCWVLQPGVLLGGFYWGRRLQSTLGPRGLTLKRAAMLFFVLRLSEAHCTALRLALRTFFGGHSGGHIYRHTAMLSTK